MTMDLIYCLPDKIFLAQNSPAYAAHTRRLCFLIGNADFGPRRLPSGSQSHYIQLIIYASFEIVIFFML